MPTPVRISLEHFALLTHVWRKPALFSILLSGNQLALAQFAQAPVEVRVLHIPQPVTGSDGLVHLAYELHVTVCSPCK